MKKNTAFTIAELSISICIISLLVAAVSVAGNIISTGRTKGAIKEILMINAAVNQFYASYNYYPGDFPLASKIWCSTACPGSSGNPNNCINDGSQAGYCNGNGNGIIELYVIDNLNGDEQVRAWQHLNLAELFPGNYTGIHAASTPGENDLGINVPASTALATTGYMFYNQRAYDNFAVNSILGGGQAATDSYNQNPYLLPHFVYEIDTKIDDGVPETGLLRGLTSNDPSGAFGTGANEPYNCVNSGTMSTYNLASTNNNCMFQYIISQ